MPTLSLVCGVYTTRVHTMFRLAVPNMKSKAVSGRQGQSITPLYHGGEPVTSDYQYVADGRFSSALFTKAQKTESAFSFLPTECARSMPSE